jgi:hypothetical protein
MRTVVVFAVLVVGGASPVGAQQSVRAPNDSVRPSKAQLDSAREATAMKCLTGEALATRLLAGGEAASKTPMRSSRGGLGLGSLDASEGLSRGALQAQFDPAEQRRSMGSGVREAMMARNEVNMPRNPCPAVPPKTAK